MATANEGRRFRVDARALLSLGRESIKDHTTAVVELIKNSYDADAENVELEIVTTQSGRIRISDDGDGMSSEDVNNKWLRIGYSEKRKETISKKGRRETGEKGIGRLSADRLGASLQLRSMANGSSAVGISVDWDRFDVDGEEIGAVPIGELEDPAPTLPINATRKSGTEIRIGNLRQPWDEKDISELELELSTLVPPQVRGADFSLWLKVDDQSEFRKLTPPFEGSAELEFEGAFDAYGLLRYVVTEKPLKPGQKRRPITSGKIAWNQLVSGASQPYCVGRFSLNLSYYLRSGVTLEGFSLSQLRDYLDTYGGVRIYRDNIRVKPYGNPAHPEGDWLGLSERKVRNPAGAARKDFRIAANQLVGAVYIGRDSNSALSDSAAREGLVHGEAFSNLKRAVFGCVVLLESIYHKRFSEKKAEKPEPQQILPNVVESIRKAVSEVKEAISEVEHDSSDRTSSRSLRNQVARLESIAEQVLVAEREIEELASQSTVYRGLSTVGISAAVFGHETESSLAQARLSTGLAFKAIAREVPKIDLCRGEIEKARAAIEKVQVWGQFALSRVKKDKRRRTKVDLGRLTDGLVTELLPLFEASSIELSCQVSTGLETRAFAMDVESLVLNLLTNAYHAAGQSKKGRRVRVSLSRESRSSRNARLMVSDSGPGIPREHINQIWLPLFSTKVDGKGRPAGTGLGLTIVKSVAAELGATLTAYSKGELGGAAIEVMIPLRS